MLSRIQLLCRSPAHTNKGICQIANRLCCERSIYFLCVIRISDLVNIHFVYFGIVVTGECVITQSHQHEIAIFMLHQKNKKKNIYPKTVASSQTQDNNK